MLFLRRGLVVAGVGQRNTTITGYTMISVLPFLMLNILCQESEGNVNYVLETNKNNLFFNFNVTNHPAFRSLNINNALAHTTAPNLAKRPIEHS